MISKVGESVITSTLRSFVDEQPNRTAVIDESTSLTYAQLSNECNILAAALLAKDIGPGDVIAVEGPRSWQRIVATVTLLNLGAIALPIDETQIPNDRHKILAKTGCRWILKCGQAPQIHLVASPALTDLPANWKATPTSSGYLITTSGTSGTPKIVHVGQEALSNYLNNLREFLKVNRTDRMLHGNSPIFDVSFEEMLLPLISGATCIVDRKGYRNDPRSLFYTAERLQLSILSMPTAYWATAIATNSIAYMPSCIRAIVVGGELLPDKHLQGWFRDAKEYVQLVNAYGPTEAAISVTLHKVGPSSVGRELGRPITGVQISIRNSALESMPPDASGEICLSGLCLSGGYVDDAKETRTKFVIPPEETDMVYRTGDKGQLTVDGNLIFEGRLDRQRKVNGGYRIELQEVEEHIAAYPGVDLVVCDTVHDFNPYEELVAWVQTQDKLAPEAIRQFLLERLLPYKIPVRIYITPRLSLNSSGKLTGAKNSGSEEPVQDYRFGNNTDVSNVGLDELDPATRAWQFTLGEQSASTTGNFFEEGGSSLQAVLMLARIADETGFSIPIWDFYSQPTIKWLQSEITIRVLARKGKGTKRNSPTCAPCGPNQAFRVGRLLDGDDSTYVIGQIIRFPYLLDAERLQAAWFDVVEHHDALRLSFHRTRGKIHARISLIADQESFSFARVADLEQETASRTSLICTRRIDVRKPSLWHLDHLQDDSRSTLILTAEHVVSDDISLNIVESDIATRYSGGSLDPKQSYIDSLLALDAYLRSPGLSKDMDYWVTTLSGHTRLELPLKAPDTLADPLCLNAKETYEHRLPPSIVATLRARSSSLGVSVFSMLAATTFISLRRFCRSQEIRIVVPISGRFRVEDFRTVGLMANRIIISDDQQAITISELSKEIHRQLESGMGHFNVPFVTLLNRLSKDSALVPSRSYVALNVLEDQLWPSVWNSQQEITRTPLESVSDTSTSPIFFTYRVQGDGLIVSLNSGNSSLGEGWFKTALMYAVHLLMSQI